MVPSIAGMYGFIAAMPVWKGNQQHAMAHEPTTQSCIEAAVKTAISALLEQLEALPAETILEYKYQIVLQERRETYQAAQQHLSEREWDRETRVGR